MYVYIYVTGLYVGDLQRLASPYFLKEVSGSIPRLEPDLRYCGPEVVTVSHTTTYVHMLCVLVADVEMECNVCMYVDHGWWHESSWGSLSEPPHRHLRFGNHHDGSL